MTSKFMYELTIKIRQAMETSNICYRSRSWLVLDGWNFAEIHLYTLG